MTGIAIIAALIVIAVIVTMMARRSNRRNNERDIITEQEVEEAIIVLSPVKHLSGIPHSPNGEKVSLYVSKEKFSVNQVQTIPMERIFKAVIVDEKNLQQVNEFVINMRTREYEPFTDSSFSRLLSTSASEGTIKGIQKVKTTYFLSIFYLNKEGGEVQALFELLNDDYPYLKKSDKIVERINSSNMANERVPYEV